MLFRSSTEFLFFILGSHTQTHTPWCRQTASLATNVVAKTSLFLVHPPFIHFVASSVFERTHTPLDVKMFFVFAASLNFSPALLTVGTLWSTFGHHFCMLFQIISFLVCSGPSLKSFFASWVRSGTPLRPRALPDQQLITQGGHQVDFRPPPPFVRFRTSFRYFCVFRGLGDFVKIEPQLGRDLNFEGPGRHKCHSITLPLPWSPFQKIDRLGS